MTMTLKMQLPEDPFLEAVPPTKDKLLDLVRDQRDEALANVEKFKAMADLALMQRNDLRKERDRCLEAVRRAQDQCCQARVIAGGYLDRLKAAGAATKDELPPWAFEKD